MCEILEFKKGKYTVSTDRAKVDADAVCSFLSKAYWGNKRSRETIIKSLNNSLIFSVFSEDKQVGMARVVTDYSTSAYLCDVYIDDEFRGEGLGKWLMECIMSYPGMTELGRFFLVTRDAHGLYEQFGFQQPKNPQIYMERNNL